MNFLLVFCSLYYMIICRVTRSLHPESLHSGASLVPPFYWGVGRSQKRMLPTSKTSFFLVSRRVRERRR